MLKSRITTNPIESSDIFSEAVISDSYIQKYE